ncbi:P1 family peptidase [Planctomycetota bacterium]
MRITVAYNLRTAFNESDAELLSPEDVDRIVTALTELKHQVALVEVSGKPNDIVERLLESEPDLIFNVAEGTVGSSREAFYPGLFEQLGIPFTGGNASLLHLNLDKQLAKTVVSNRGIAVPKGTLVTVKDRKLPSDLRYPLFIKPNAEGSSKGITQDSVVETPKACRDRIESLLKDYPAGLVVEEFISGRELSIPFLEAYPGGLLEIVEHTFDLRMLNSKFNIYDYNMKQGGDRMAAVGIVCPAPLETDEKRRLRSMAKKIFSFMNCPDFGRIDVRLSEDGTPYFIELNPLPSIHPIGSMMTAARTLDLEYKDVLRLIVRSAARRFGIPLRRPRKTKSILSGSTPPRPTARELGITVGRMKPGVFNAITDVPGVKVGQINRIENDVTLPGVAGKTAVRTGVTAILPAHKDIHKNRLVAGGFVLNGVGEMAGLTQIMEWGWLESPILLTNSMSVGRVHQGVVSHMHKRNPKIGTESDVVLPVVGETDDSFLNDVRVGVNTSEDAQKAIVAAASGPVAQGSVGAGTGMISFDFAGGIGTSSRTLMQDEGGFTVGVIVLSNFGKMVNLTIDGGVVGRRLDTMFPKEGRRENSYGSAIVVVATDAPLLASQLNRLAKRAALGLGRVGSHAASTSGEIVVAFSTANHTPRTTSPDKFLKLKFIADPFINPLYEAVIEATEEAVLNAIFCSNGMDGRLQRFAPAIPQDQVNEMLLEQGATPC